ncbi:MAG: hypothetical protein ACRENP_05705 [Longimicrobiales bacterium]
MVAPGFWDIQSHSRGAFLGNGDGRVVSKVTMGVTTEIMGEGSTNAIINARTQGVEPGTARADSMAAHPFAGERGFDNWLRAMEQHGASVKCHDRRTHRGGQASRSVTGLGRRPNRLCSVWRLATRRGERLFAHSGSVPGYTALLVGNLDRKIGFAIMTNGNRAHPYVYRLADRALEVIKANTRARENQLAIRSETCTPSKMSGFVRFGLANELRHAPVGLLSLEHETRPPGCDGSRGTTGQP